MGGIILQILLNLLALCAFYLWGYMDGKKAKRGA